jgi:hypothetical protein
MKKQLEEILKSFCPDFCVQKRLDDCTSQILQLLESVVPEEKDITKYKDEIDLPTTAIIGQEQGFNACREEMLRRVNG